LAPSRPSGGLDARDSLSSNVVQSPKAYNLAGAKEPSDDDFTGESHATLRDGVASSGGEAGGSGHHRVTVTHDALSYLVCQLSRIQNHNKHRVCLLKVDVWVSDGSDTQNMLGT
jgi:hypothetical protein